MSKVTGPAHWCCDACTYNGGIVDEDETLPSGWLSISILVGRPQLAEEQRADRRVHLCESCAELFLFTQIIGKSADIDRLREIFRRPGRSLSDLVSGSSITTR